MGTANKALQKKQKAAYIKALRLGVSHDTAAGHARVHRATAFRWRKLGEEGNPDHVQFFEDCLDAVSSVEMSCLANVRGAGDDGDWRAAAFILERRFHKSWSKNERRELSVSGTVPVVMDAPALGDVAANLTKKDPSDE